MVSQVFREQWGRIVATLIRMTGDWDLAEECAQDAMTRALERWPHDGIPQRPGAWLMTAARNHAFNRLRRASTEATKLRELAATARPDESDDDPSGVPDDRLRLIFTCCHPALPLDERVALTLRTLTGLTTAEIARAFMVTVPTMAQRLVRAKRKIRQAGIPYRVPPADTLRERTTAVLGVTYLLFNEGYAATTGSDATRPDLCGEAIYLGETLHRLIPDDPEVAGLLALMHLHEARRPARVDGAGNLVALDDQDRSLWDQAAVARGVTLLETASRHHRSGTYQIQAAIAACHATAPTAAATDWPQIAALYAKLAELTPNPVVELNRAVAVAMADGPAAGLVLVDRLEEAGHLTGYHLLPATRADLLRRLGRAPEAAASYRRALELAGTEADRRYLTGRLAEVTGEGWSQG